MSRTLRPLAALAMVAMVALISAGCGTGSSTDDKNAATAPAGTGGSGGNKNASAHEKAVMYRAAVWFMCSEALANVARHAQAARAAVLIEHVAGALELEISDDGRGGATLTRGLRGLADRVDALGGTLVVSSPSGGPTAICVLLTVPDSMTELIGAVFTGEGTARCDH